jgi:hypothetical protein
MQTPCNRLNNTIPCRGASRSQMGERERMASHRCGTLYRIGRARVFALRQDTTLHAPCSVVAVEGYQAAALFFIAPIIAVSIAPPAPPAIACEIMPPTLRLPDCTAAMTEGNSNVTIWPSTPPPTKPETMLPTVPRSNVGDDLPAPTPPSAPATRLISICSI